MLFGCGGCLGLIVLMAIAGGVFFVSILGVIKNTDVYKTALQRAQQSPAVQEALGAPINDTFMVMGKVSTDNGQGTADFQIPVTGSKTGGAIICKASKPPGGQWEFSQLEVVVGTTNQTINLLGP